MFSWLYLYFPDFYRVWKIAGQISRLSRIQDCVQTLYLKFKKRISTESKIFRQSTEHLRLQSGEERTCLCMQELLSVNRCYLHGAGLAQSVEHLTAKWEVAGSIPRTGPTPRVLKWLRNEGTAFTLQMARPSHGPNDHVKWRSRLQ